MTEPHLAPIESSATVIIQPVANGGFVVSARGSHQHPGECVQIIGAFTNRADLLVALGSAF